MPNSSTSRPATHQRPDREVIQDLTRLELKTREEEIFAQVSLGNVPAFLRGFCPIAVTNVADSKTNSAQFFALPNNLAVGTDTD